mmetsp:Transcript_23289/g.45237  ORF Transcript_23289/g.45237 Transcript_23289/m.45237 type:complete len:687 (-) Transcript_23289:45-2105(-)
MARHTITLLGGILVVLSVTTVRLADSAKLRAHSHTHANPIRKVIRLLQAMDEKVREEGKVREKLFEKYMCYCTSSEESLTKSIATGEDRLPQLQSSTKEAVAEHSQLQEELKQHQTERSEAQKAITTSSALGEKELQALGAEETELKENIKALGRAAEAVQKGMGDFLQTSAAKTLQKISLAMDMATADRDVLASFLVGESNAAEPQSGEILGILKEMYDQMAKDLKRTQDEITTTTNNLENLLTAKKREVAAASKAIEAKTGREGELAVDIATLKHDLADVSETLDNDQTFLVDLKKRCKVKQDEWKEYQTIQSQELIALSETIKLLNDDDALELFKKTLPSPAASFMESPLSFLQMKKTARGFRRRAVASLRAVSTSDSRYDLLELAVRGEAHGFEKIIKMIDDLIRVLRQEGTEDDHKKEFCSSEMDKTEDELKVARRAVSDTKAKIANRADSLEDLNFAIADMVAGIKELDKQVADATAGRQKEHAQSTEELAENSAAKGLLEVAKNRLSKFYNAKLFKAPPEKKEETGVEFLQHGYQQPEEPEADLSYKKKGEEHGGVVAMINMLREDLIKKITVMETEEREAQSDYEQYVAEVTKKRALDSKALSDKEGEKAEIEASLHEDKETLSDQHDDVLVTQKELANLHQDCDWFLKNFDLRRQARIDEQDALSKAKAVLSGADFS